MDKIKVFIVDDDKNWLQLITIYLGMNEDIAIVGTACDKKNAYETIISTEVDVVLMDINLSNLGYDGIDLLLDITEVKKLNVIMLTSLSDEESILQSFTGGAINFINKTRYTEVPEAIRSIYQKNSPYGILIKELQKLKQDELLSTLTPAEREVFDLLVLGHSRNEIMNILYKTESTVKNQIHMILKKLNVASTKDAIEKVRKKGIGSYFYRNRGGH